MLPFLFSPVRPQTWEQDGAIHTIHIHATLESDLASTSVTFKLEDGNAENEYQLSVEEGKAGHVQHHILKPDTLQMRRLRSTGMTFTGPWNICTHMATEAGATFHSSATPNGGILRILAVGDNSCGVSGSEQPEKEGISLRTALGDGMSQGTVVLRISVSWDHISRS